MLPLLAGLLLMTAAFLAGAGGGRDDIDRDGVPDKLEQRLLERFVPEFILGDDECDGLPAELAAGTQHPVMLVRNGTIYGQAFRKGRDTIELHYFHLWGRDCGRAGHALDAEHVSALVAAERSGAPARKWRARYWYAAGHEGTICDRSTAARAEVIGAVERGPRVWLAAGKHASYLDAAWCSWGCGADRCALNGAMLRPRRIVNLGERGAPMNGATWTGSSRWNLSAKLGSDFPADLQMRLDASSSVKLLWPGLRPAQSMLMAGGEVGAAFHLADSETGQALGASVEQTGRALKRSADSVARFLGYGRR